jgi:hypothetical protein
VVAGLGRSQLEEQRADQLQTLLEPVVNAVRQLGIPVPAAVAAFRNMLNGASASSGRKHA